MHIDACSLTLAKNEKGRRNFSIDKIRIEIPTSLLHQSASEVPVTTPRTAQHVMRHEPQNCRRPVAGQAGEWREPRREAQTAGRP